MRNSRFGVGDVIKHRLFGYRGVVVDVDAGCLASDEWYETVARSCPPRDKPWYHVLPDGMAHTTYVAERNLLRDHLGEPVEHPLIEEIFDDFIDGRYLFTDDRLRHSLN